jgi:hypothetical protein
MAAPLEVDALLGAIRDRISEAPSLGVQVWRLSDGSDLPSGAAEYGVTVQAPITQGTTAGRNRTVEGSISVTTIAVTLYKRIPAGVSGFGTAEDLAIQKARDIRKRLTGEYSPMVGGACVHGGLFFRREERGTHPSTLGWYRAILTFEATHIIALGE